MGGVKAEGEKVLRQLFTFAAKKLGREFSSFCSRGWARVSCCLQRSVAQMILSRIDGVSAESELSSESFAVASGKSSVVGEWPVGKSSIGRPFSEEFSVGQSIGMPSAGESSVVQPVEQKGKQLPSVVSQSWVEAKPVVASQSRAGAKPPVASQSKAEYSANTQSKAEVQQPGVSGDATRSRRCFSRSSELNRPGSCAWPLRTRMKRSTVLCALQRLALV